MTRIRRINVSQVEGDNANNTDVNEIRPFGETAFYLDTDPATDKLVLMMFDGIRTNLKSKVLTPGILFGSNADSGDGAGFDTIKLIPDATLHRAGGAYDNDQYLIVDPTAPNHIHLRAGGVQDNSTAQLFIGGESSHFSIGYGLNPSLYVVSNSNIWAFDGTGALSFPSGLNIAPYSIPEVLINGTVISQPNGNKLQVFSIGTGGGSAVGWLEDASAPNGGVAAIDFNNNTANSASIMTGSFSSNVYTWTFNNTGNIELPGGGTISAADYDIDIVAGNNGVGTFGSVTINTQAPAVTYPVVQQTSPQGTDVITTNIIETPYIASIVPGMPVIGSGITVPTTVDSVIGPDIYGTYTINLTPAVGQQLPYLETYTIGGAGVSNNVWEFDSQGAIFLPRGGMIGNNGNSSGDGNGYSTMVLVPDGMLEGNDQYIILDPTAPGHIHIRAGGMQDSSNADLILGGENSNFKVPAGPNPVVEISSNGNVWVFGTDGNITLPVGGTINWYDGSNALVGGGGLGVTGPTGPQGAAGNNGDTGPTGPSGVSADQTLNTNSSVTFGNVQVSGNVTAANFIGNISITGNVTGTSANVELVAGSYTYTFDNTGMLVLPAMGGDEGGEINFGIPSTNTTLTTRVVLDVYRDRVRFFDGSTKGAYIDLSQAATGVDTLLNNRVSGFVNAGTFVTMDNIKATVTTSGNRGLSLATVTGSFTYNIGGTYGAGVGNGGASTGGQTLTTTPTASIFGWGFVATGDIANYTLTDTTNNRCYRITVQIGASFNNNSIIIERLI